MERAQAHTLEAFAAGMLLLGSVIFALQVTTVTPLTASTASQHIENQQGAVANGVLATAAENGNLRPAVLYWNASGGEFHGAPVKGTYPLGGPPLPFGQTLNETFSGRGIAFNVNVEYLDTGRNVRTEEMVRLGTPSDNAVVAARTVTLYDDDVLYDPSGEPTDTTLNETASFYAPDAAPNSSVYNVIRVEVVVWRM